MEITLDLAPDVYRAVEELAAERRQSVVEFVKDAILQARDLRPARVGEVVIDEHGFPVLRLGRPVTLEEVQAAIEED